MESRSPERPAAIAESRRQEQLRLLTRVSRALTYARDLREVLNLAVEQAAELLGARKAVLMLADSDGLLHVRAAHGIDSELVDRFSEPLDESLIHRLNGLVAGYRSDESFLGAPLVVQAEVTGFLGVWRSGDADADGSDELLLSALADQAAVAVENARLADEVRQDEERLKVAEGASEMRERALMTLSHDLRSPLSAIDSYAELMEMELYGPLTDQQRQALGRIRMSGRHLLSILQDVLEMARITTGSVRLRAEAVSAADVVRQASELVAVSASTRRQTLEALAGDGLHVHGDSDRLRQVLVNLLSNASKYTPDGGSIAITAERCNREGVDWGVISVTDTGPGIPRDEIESIFEPYYRIPGGEIAEGIGLGLTISRGLVRQMGGELDVESELGAGASFRVWLLIADPEDTRSDEVASG